MALYPPILPTSIPAFSADSQIITIDYEWPKTASYSYIDDGKLDIQYSLVYQNTNTSALTGEELTQGLITQAIRDYSFQFTINKNNVSDGWKAGTIYKLQARFNYDKGAIVSEWSTICYLKATAAKADIKVEILNTGDFIISESPVFYGKYTNSSDVTEIEKRYKFDLFSLNTNSLISSTGWKLHNNDIDNAIFSVLLENFTKYIVTYSIETKNGYTQSVDYSFTCSLDILDSPNLSFKEVKLEREDGRVKLNIVGQEFLSTNLVLRRSDSRSNFTQWQDLKYFNILDEIPNIVFYDYLVEHGIDYKYGIQAISEKGYRSELKYIDNPISVAYDDMFLVGNNKQLKIQYNPKVSSWKRNLQESKVDTIGSQYPFITRNGNVNYFTFPINGLISYHMDEQEAFCSKNSLCVNNQITTAVRGTRNRVGVLDDWAGDINLDDINLTLEREFRNQVEEFLTNGDYKFFKSPTEGIKLISLTGISLSPIDALGRMLYSFSGTAYEVGSAEISNILTTDIQALGDYIKVEDMGTKVLTGKINNLLVVSGDNIYNKITESLNSVINDRYNRKVEYLQGISIEIVNSEADFKFTIYQDPSNIAAVPITINKTIGYYELNDIIKIYNLIANTGATINITYQAVCSYTELEDINNDYNANLSSQSGFIQYVETFSSEGTDVYELIKTRNNLYRLLNLSFLRIDGTENTKYQYNNGEEFAITEKGFETRELVTSLKIKGYASVSFVYNGVVKK